MKNPNWSREELILALELYFEIPHNKISENNKRIKELSQYLISLPVHSKELRTSTFRNSAGVAGKLGNFLPYDKTYVGTGRSRGSKLDPLIFNEFVDNRVALKKEARALRIIFQDILTLPNHVQDKISSIEAEVDEATGLEGGIIYKTHRYIERDYSIVKRKKRNTLKERGKLECEVCEFDFHKYYGARGAGFAECHHIKPLHTISVKTKTKEKDLAILCANCHRMIHKRPFLSIEELKLTISKF